MGVRTARTLVAGALMAGALSIGFAGAASAATPPASMAARCTHAQARLDRLHTTQSRLDTAALRLQSVIDRATQKGHADRAAAAQTRLDKVKTHETTVADRIARIQARCTST
jgi:hypothetical protein